MQPTLRTDDVVIGWRWPLRVGAMVAARYGARTIIKRLERIDGEKVYLVGDNRHESTDSRHYGNLDRSAILGTIMIVLPKATPPPKPLRPYAVLLGRIVAAVLVGMALVHLYRIDTFIPLLDKALPVEKGGATAVALIIIMSEIFAIPFALRMRLSPLAHLVSANLMVFAPLWWVLIDITTYALTDATGQLGEFVAVPSTLPVLVLNIVWLLFSYGTLYLLGYNQLSLRQLLKK